MGVIESMLPCKHSLEKKLTTRGLDDSGNVVCIEIPPIIPGSDMSKLGTGQSGIIFYLI